MNTKQPQNLPNVLVVSGGHAHEHEPFIDIFRENDEITFAQADPPAVRSWFSADKAGVWDAIVCYDMQGVQFRKPEPPNLEVPPADYAAGFRDMLEHGQGMVFLHHSLSAWPLWPLWAEVLGGRWSYVPGKLRGEMYPSSGYTHADTEHHISVLRPDHPVCAGLGEGFDIVDEIYLHPTLDDTFIPLLKSSYPMTAGNFFSGELATRAQLYSSDGWTHPDGNGYMGWVKVAGNSPIVYLQSGHGPSAYANQGFRTLLNNAIQWVASDEAHAWARDNSTTLALA